jgi:TNF receptor-associated factor 4
LSIFVCLCKGDYDALQSWPFSHRITLTLIDQNPNDEQKRHVVKSIKPNICKENTPFLGRPQNDKNVQFGVQKFIDIESLQTLDYLLDDTIFVKFDVDFTNVDVL